MKHTTTVTTEITVAELRTLLREAYGVSKDLEVSLVLTSGSTIRVPLDGFRDSTILIIKRPA